MLSRRTILLAIAVILIAAAGFVAARMFAPPPEGLDLARERPTENGLFVVAIEPEAAEFRRADLHSWVATVRTPDGAPVEDARVRIDGGMPQHGHGLPTAPQASEHLGDGRYLIEGVRFNMGGWWEFRLDIASAAGTDAVVFNLVF